jgi:hypothetical protein
MPADIFVGVGFIFGFGLFTFFVGVFHVMSKY